MYNSAGRGAVGRLPEIIEALEHADRDRRSGRAFVDWSKLDT